MKHASLNLTARTINSTLVNRQGRTFGPFWGFLLANLLAKLVATKQVPFLPLQLDLSSSPWLAYNKPTQVSSPANFEQWQPLENPYPTFTNAPHSNYDNYEYGLEDEYKDIEIEPIASESKKRTYYTRRKSNNKRQGSKRYRKRRRTTTTTPQYDEDEDSYYDSYEESYPQRRRPGGNRFRNSYEDEESEEEYDFTTPRYKPKRKRPYRNKNREEFTTRNYFNNDVQTEILIVRQRQDNPDDTTTTPSPTRESTTTTTTSLPTTLITNGTTTTESTITTTGSTSTTIRTNNSTTYGYGPSNGNENISITYGPPHYHHQYSAPFYNWYNHQNTRNAIVRRVQNIVGFDDNFFRKRSI